MIPEGFKIVSFAADCYCPLCETTGPTEDGVEYLEIEGTLYGRRIEE